MVRFFHVARAYDSREVLSDVTLQIGGETVLITGPPGSGKSVLLRLLCGLEAPSHGWITVDGLPLVATSADVLAAHRRRLAILPQRPLLIEDRSVLDNVALALEIQRTPLHEARERAAETLVRVDGTGLSDRVVSTLSVGERRLVSVARMLVREEAKLLVVDEPADGLDATSQRRVGVLLAERAERGATVIVASRHAGLPGLGSPRVLFLDGGRIAWDSHGDQASEAS